MDLVPLPWLVLAGVLLGFGLASPVAAIGRWRRGEGPGHVALSTGLFALVTAQFSHRPTPARRDLAAHRLSDVCGAHRIRYGGRGVAARGHHARGDKITVPGTLLFADPLDLQARLLPSLRDPAMQAIVATRLITYFNAREAHQPSQLVGLRGVVEWRVIQADGSVRRWDQPIFAYAADAS